MVVKDGRDNVLYELEEARSPQALVFTDEDERYAVQEWVNGLGPNARVLKVSVTLRLLDRTGSCRTQSWYFETELHSKKKWDFSLFN
jgi:hypothetical protein